MKNIIVFVTRFFAAASGAQRPPQGPKTTEPFVPEKAGYRLEGRMRESAIKEGEVTDQLMYAILRDEAAMIRPAGGAK